MKLHHLLLLSGASAAAVSAVAFVSFRRGVERDWQAMVAQLDAMEAERLAEPTLRGALHGETTDGAAWPHYQLAIEELRGIEDFNRRARAAARAVSDEERAARDVLLAEAQTLFAHLHRGAHARDVTSPIDWSAGMAARIQRLSEVRPITELAVARLIACIEDGDDERGVETLLDAQQFARDLAVSPVLVEEMIGVSEMVPAAAIEFLARDGDRLSIAAEERWLDGLDALEASLPEDSAALRGEVELVGRHFLRIEQIADSGEWPAGTDRGPSWRYGFSWRAAAADYVLRGASIARELEAAELGPPAEALRVLEERERGVAADPNPLFAMAMPKFSSAARSRYWNLARLSYLRHALALDLGRTPGEPLDPFGNGVQVEVNDERIHVWTEVEPRNPNELAVRLVR